MNKWFRARWRAYMESSDPAVLMSASAPHSIVLVVGALVCVYLTLAYVPVLREASGFRHVWISVALAILGGLATWMAWRQQCRGLLGGWACLLDNTFYSSSLVFSAIHTRGNVGLAIAVVHGISVVAFPGQVYAPSLVFGATMVLPIVAMLIAFQPPLSLTLVIVCSLLMMFVFSTITDNRRATERRQKKLEDALGAADRLADESVQAALTTTLLTLGHFLHELRNLQTAVSTNLDYIAVKSELHPSAAEALKDAQTAQAAQERILRETIADLRKRATPATTGFLLGAAIKQIAAEPRDIQLEALVPEAEFEVPGNPEHLKVVVLNLVRNAEQAGASRVRLECRVDSSGQAALLTIQDDGPGIPGEQQRHIFDSFALSNKPGGSGMGLYLSRRYVELLGGKVSVGQGALGGACFHLRLPGEPPRKVSRLGSVA